MGLLSALRGWGAVPLPGQPTPGMPGAPLPQPDANGVSAPAPSLASQVGTPTAPPTLGPGYIERFGQAMMPQSGAGGMGGAMSMMGGQWPGAGPVSDADLQQATLNSMNLFQQQRMMAEQLRRGGR